MFVVLKLPGDGLDLSRSIQDVILTLALVWSEELKRRPLPSIYKGSIVYRPEPEDNEAEEWTDPYTLRERGYGDCDDLVIARLAELYVKAGQNADTPRSKLIAWPSVARKKGTNLYHVMIRHKSGELEDPSQILYPKS